ncbi:META domain-containing protein, partial [Cryomorpha ignava]
DGVDFIAFGKNPDWQLVITKNNELSIATKTDFGSFGAPNLEGMEPQDLNAMVYGAQTQKGTISVMVFSDSCLSHEVGLLPNRVKISAQKADRAVAQFIGCGLYLNDPTLHDIWAVRSWSSLDSTEKIPKGAYLEFNMQTNRIYGNLGCGEITGYFDPMGSRLKIYRMDYADKNCAEESISISLFSALNFSTHELIIKDGLELRLISNGDTITFIKAD